MNAIDHAVLMGFNANPHRQPYQAGGKIIGKRHGSAQAANMPSGLRTVQRNVVRYAIDAHL